MGASAPIALGAMAVDVYVMYSGIAWLPGKKRLLGRAYKGLRGGGERDGEKVCSIRVAYGFFLLNTYPISGVLSAAGRQTIGQLPGLSRTP